jgi:hypothetical protein
MAGGTFNKRAGKVRPGTYINFESTRNDTVGGSERGTVVIPLTNATYGPAKQWITLTNASPDGAYAMLGYSIYDEDENRQMLLIREAFKKASEVLLYITNEGTNAAITKTSTTDESITSTITATAKYGGSRGNALVFAIAQNPVEGFDVTVALDATTVAEYEGLKTVEDLIAEDCEYITFTGSGNLFEIAGANLTGGTDGKTNNTDITGFLDALEAVRFNTVCFPIAEESLQAAAKTKITYMREDVGRQVQIVMPDTKSGDYEGIINVTNSVAISDDKLSHAEACAWVAAATAAAENTDSLTYVAYDGATEVVDPKSHEEAVAAINNGEFFFSISESGDVVVEYDINSLVTFSKPKDKTYRKNRVIRVFDTFAESIQLNFPPNKFDNNSTGWNIMEGIGRTILKQFEDAGAITNVDSESDFLVDRELSQGDETYFNVGLQAVDSAEKLYFTIATR